jgi:hypothetical protein
MAFNTIEFVRECLPALVVGMSSATSSITGDKGQPMELSLIGQSMDRMML